MLLAKQVLSLVEGVIEEKPDKEKNYTVWQISTGNTSKIVRTSLGKSKYDALQLFKKAGLQVFNVIHLGDSVDGVYTEVANKKSESVHEGDIEGEYTLFDGEELKKIG